MPFNLYLYGGIAAMIIALSSATYIYKLKFDKALIQQQVAEQQRDTMLEVNNQILAANIADAKLRDKLYEDFKGARDDAETYRVTLAKHDLASLAAAKPGLITIYARRATDRVLRDIEAAANASEAVPEPASSGHGDAKTPSTDGHGT